MRGRWDWGRATHSVEALDVGDVPVDEEVHLAGQAGHPSSAPGPGNERHVRRVSDVGGVGGSWRRGRV